MKATILIVEDHDAVRRVLHDWLSATFPDVCFLEAATGEVAVGLFLHGPQPDIVIMDLSLPGIGGIEATRRIRTIAPQTNVVILTIHDAVDYRRDAEAAGACAYVLKSTVSIELILTLKQLLNGLNAPEPGEGGNPGHESESPSRTAARTGSGKILTAKSEPERPA